MDKKHDKLRVAIYTRVARECDLGEIQKYQCRSFISGNLNAKVVAKYRDVGSRGAAFERMTDACERGEIDCIVTSSMSRFARNTRECLELIRKLQSLGTEMIFEKERLDTRNAHNPVWRVLGNNFGTEDLRHG